MSGYIRLQQPKGVKADTEVMEKMFAVRNKALNSILPFGPGFSLQEHSVTYPIAARTSNDKKKDIVDELVKFEHLCHKPMQVALDANTSNEIKRAKQQIGKAKRIARCFPYGLDIIYLEQGTSRFKATYRPTLYDLNNAEAYLKEPKQSMTESITDYGPILISPEGIAAFDRQLRGARDPEVLSRLEGTAKGAPIRMDVDPHHHTIRVRVPIITRVY